MSISPDFLLSPANPLANRDQTSAEQTALRVRELPAFREARDRAAFLWRLAYGEDTRAEALPCFEQAMDEYAFNYLLKAVASDPGNPRLVRDFMPPHRWFGRDMPGARMGGDNPDNCYRVGGIEHGRRYAVHGRIVGTPAACVTFTLVGNYGTSVTIRTLELDDVVRGDDGSFALTIDADPAAGRPNHLQTAPACKFLFVRDSMGDWETETPLALQLVAFDPAPDATLTEQQVAERAAHRMCEDVPLYYWFTRLFSGKPVNTLTLQAASGSLGGLVTQVGAQGRLRLADDEAAIVRVDPAGAGYAGIVLHDWWFRTLPYWKNASSLTTRVSLPDADGCHTYVISAADPGVHNWVDTCGLRETLLLYRWQHLPRQPVRGGPAVEPLRVVKLKDLESALPNGTVRIDAAGRARQLERRAAGFARRVIER